MTTIRMIERYLGKYNKWLLVFLMTFIAALITLQVILRYILHLPMHFAEEILTFCAVWVYLLGAVNASREESHINARILEIFCNRPAQVKAIRVIAAAASTAVFVWLDYWSYDFLLYSIKRAKVSQILGYPLILTECAMFLCVTLMAIYTFSEFVCYCLKKTEIKEEGEEVI